MNTKSKKVHHGGALHSLSPKSRAALALAVSLWIAGGGVASAESIVDVYINADDNTQPIQPIDHFTQSVTDYPASVTEPTRNSSTQFTVTGDWSEDTVGDDWYFYGGYSAAATDVAGYSLVLDHANVSYAYGGYSVSGNATGNHVTLTDSEADNVRGGYTGNYQNEGGDANDNEVRLTRSTAGYVAGGVFDNGTNKKATYNKVYLTDSTVNGPVFGGAKANGSGDLVTGNELYLSGANTVKYRDSYFPGKVQNFQTINIVEAKWGTPVLTFSPYIYTDGSSDNPDGILQNADGSWAAIDASKLKFDNPETIANGATMNLIDGPVGDATLAATTTAKQEYTVTPVTGVLVNAAFQGQLSIPDTKDALICTAENKATKLTFGNVEWKDSGALLDHAATLTNVSFNGANVDTANINFTNLQSLEANKKMTLVKDFGDTVGTITGAKYKVGSTLEGEGKASLVGSDLIFTAETGAPASDEKDDNGGGSGELILEVQEQTHNTVMGATVGMAALSAGNDFIGAATEGLSLASNIGADGVSSFAQMGGGSMRQETGSHVDTHTWNAILALGHQNKKERGTFEYGAFFEYGSGNYTTHNGDERGDGSAHYTGGGLLAKWTAKHGFYVEGSLRAGTVHDDARNVLRDANGVPYSYETNANYFGGHVGVGKEIPLANGNTVDVYGKYFVNRRNGVSFEAGGHYDLDAVTSQVLRIGARYTVKGKKWNFYAGAAYEHELDGKANGKADGVAIRGADTSGASFRGEIGATVKPGENSPWNIDLNVSGFAGKKQGVTGGVSVSFMF